MLRAAVVWTCRTNTVRRRLERDPPVIGVSTEHWRTDRFQLTAERSRGRGRRHRRWEHTDGRALGFYVGKPLESNFAMSPPQVTPT